MAWFSKPRGSARSAPTAPAPCTQCSERPGTVLMHIVADAKARPGDAATRAVWLCDACRDEICRDAADN